MSDSIYKQHALKYLRKGYSVIPDQKGSKVPCITGWNSYAKKMPSLEEVNQWCEIKDANISILFGEMNGIVALDLDTNDEEIIGKIAHLLPDSPVSKFGSKGWTRFFKFNGEASQEVYENYVDESDGVTKKRVILELLSSGKKTTIPESIHPKGMPYKWIGSSLLDVDKESLPTLPSNLLSVIAEKLKLNQNSFGDASKVHSGRNSALGAFCADLIKNQYDLETAVNKLIDYDVKTNTPPLFSDSEEFKTPYPVINATKFYVNYLESINIKRKNNNLLPELPMQITAIDTKSANLDTEIGSKEVFELPKATGLLKEMIDYILAKSYVEQPVLAMSSALVTLGTLVSRKTLFQGVTSNLYVLNIGSSGSGKDSVQQAAKTMLKAAKADRFLGASAYPSEASIIAFLSANPVRLDVIDEAASFLKSASSGGASYQTGIGDLLCELYTSSNEHYLGKTLGSDGGKKVGECYRPHLNILCSTTFRGVSEGISHSTLEKGLFARFLTFFGEDSKPAKRIRNQVHVPKELADRLAYWAAWENPKGTGDIGGFLGNTPPFEIGIEKDADELLDKYFYKLDDLKCKTSEQSVSKPVIARLYQQMLKIIMISCISNTKGTQIPKATVQDVQFGYDMIRFFASQINDFIENTIHDNERSRFVNKILSLIKKAGHNGITNVELLNRSSWIRGNDRQEIIRDLSESKKIMITQKVVNGAALHVFTYIGEAE